MTAGDRPEPFEETSQGAAAAPRFRLLKVGATLALLVLSSLGLSQCGWVQQARLDREVDRLCAIDGGVHIYETVTLPKENFGPDGEVFPQYRHLPSNNGRFSSAYVVRRADKILVGGYPAMERINTLIVRVSDDKVLGERVIYRRSGGDVPGPWAPSRHSCPEDGPDLDLEGQVFKPEP